MDMIVFFLQVLFKVITLNDLPYKRNKYFIYIYMKVKVRKDLSVAMYIFIQKTRLFVL